MKKFLDYYDNKVNLSFSDHPFSENPKHVWVLCRYEGKWLLTKHKERGLEFPGGKVEGGETPLEAASREVLEETGGEVANLTYIGQYEVFLDERIVKNIYYAEIKSLLHKEDYLETAGPKLLKELPDNIKNDKQFSFIMKDDVLQYSLKRVQEKGLL